MLRQPLTRRREGRHPTLLRVRRTYGAMPLDPRIEVTAARLDPAVERARRAGGPVDRASYCCSCGYTFLAEVSTTVTCPHCHAFQAW